MPTLFMLLIGCKPSGRNTEQHDVYFGIGETVNDLIPELISFWPEAKGKLHIDAWRAVTSVDGFAVSVIQKKNLNQLKKASLFFINLGGYKKDEFEEFHYKMIVAAVNKGGAIQQSKKTAFYRHTGFEGATSHIDDKYGIDVDDIHEIDDLLGEESKKQFSIYLDDSTKELAEDELHLGYFKLSSFQ